MARLFMTFYSYGSTVYNSNLDVIGRKGNFKTPSSTLKFLSDLALLNVFPAMGTIAMALAAGRMAGPDDDENWIAWLMEHVGREAVSSALNGLVLVRELSQLTQEGTRGYGGPAGARLFQLLNNWGQQIKQWEFDESLIRTTNQAAGLVFAYPAAQAERTVDGFVALQSGRTSNPAALLFGAPKAASQ